MRHDPQATNQQPADTKRRLRREFHATLATLDRGELHRHSDTLTTHLADWLAASGATSIAVFAAIAREADLSALHRRCPDLRLHYPLCRGDHLDFHLVDDPGDLRAGCHGVPEPLPALHPACSLTDLEVFLCPGLAFSPCGARLGRGAGYYDRLLAQSAPGALRVGIGFELQCRAPLPVEPHDVLMTHLATEHGVRTAELRP